MSADVAIDALLEQLGFVETQSRIRARAMMEEANLTRSGKARISDEKVPRVRALLLERFYLHCSAEACVTVARASTRALLATTKLHCQSCGGSDNRRAAESLLTACRAAGVRKLAVVGGSPAVREELVALLGSALELRLIDGTERRTADRAAQDLAWADLLLLWGGSELDHKVSIHYPRGRVVQVAKRGIAALLNAALEHLRLQHRPKLRDGAKTR